MNAQQNARDNNFALLHILGAMFVICGHSYVLLGKAAPMLMGVPIHMIGVEMLFAELAVPNALNGSLWTLPIELICYLLLPLIVLCYGRTGRRQSCIPPAIVFLLLVIGDTCIQIQGADIPRLIVWGTDWV